MSDNELKDVVNARMAIKIEGRRIGLYGKSPASDLSLVSVRLNIGYQLITLSSVLVREKPASPPRTTVSHNGAVKELTDSRLTRLMWCTQPIRIKDPNVLPPRLIRNHPD